MTYFIANVASYAYEVKLVIFNYIVFDTLMKLLCL
jgi:hypothetical protein